MFINDDMNLLRAPLAKALRFPVNINSVAMVNENVVTYKTFENLYKIYEWDPCFI